MNCVDLGIIILFFAITLGMGLLIGNKTKSKTEYLLGGRALTMPAFVATTVSTWYGGILGVGEYGWSNGISNWLVFGVPYYIGALLFAFLYSKRARQNKSLTLPQQLSDHYGPRVGTLAAILVCLTTLPIAYMLIMGTLLDLSFNLPPKLGIYLTTAFIILYLWKGGFTAVTKTDGFQCFFMFGGFIMLVIVLLTQYGTEPLQTLPDTHLSPTGGAPIGSILIWYIIALSTLAQPNFFQRAFAAKTPEIAKKGMLISIALWTLFDAMTTLCALYARALLPDLQRPLLAFPELAIKVLPTGLLGIFFVGMFATVLSTLDSNLFTVASTLGHDFTKNIALTKQCNNKENIQNNPQSDKHPESEQNDQTKQLENTHDTNASKRVVNQTRIGLLIAALCTMILATQFESVVSIWKIFGSISAATLLIPILSTYYPRFKMSEPGILTLMGASGLTTCFWFIKKSTSNVELLGLDPLIAGGIVALLVFAFDKLIHHTLAKD